MAAALTAAAVLQLVSAYPWDADKAAWVVYQESRNYADVISANGKYAGLMQVDYRLHGYSLEQMQDPARNIAAAYRLYAASGWQPWPVASQYPGGGEQVAEVTPDGWLTWAERMQGRPVAGPGFNAGVNDVRGLVFHSAEGYAATMLSKESQWGYYSAAYPWHLSNLLDGRLIQHYPFTARCWHGSAFNDSYVGMENEGKTPDGAAIGPALNGIQVANARRVIASLSQWKGWTPKRPTSASDKTATLWQHSEVVRFGGSGTQCPSGRIPWAAILAAPIQEDDIMVRFNATVPSARGKQAPFTVGIGDFDQPIPAGAKRLRIEIYIEKERAMPVQVFDSDGKYAFQVGWAGERYGCGDVYVDGGGFSIQGQAGIAQVGVVAIA